MGILPLKNKPERSNFHLIPKLPPQASLAVQRNHRSIESYRRRELHHHRHTQRFIVSECLPPWLLFLDPTVFIASICDSPAISANVEPSGFEIIPLHHYTAIKHVSTTPRHGLFFFRTFGVVWGQAPRLGRRSYVTAQPHEAEKGSDLPWLIGSLALGVPLVTYLMQTGPEKKVHYGHFRPEVREALEKGHPIQSVDLEKPSAIDPAQATKFPEGSGTISHKQVGLDNYNSSNPAIAIAGKSVKGEGDTDTTKLQGTVDPGRRQA